MEERVSAIPVDRSEQFVVLNALQQATEAIEARLVALHAKLDTLAQAQRSPLQGASLQTAIPLAFPESLSKLPEFEGPFASLKRVIESHWRADASLGRLEAEARENGLQIYEWDRFDDVLRSMATSTVDLSFPKWTSGSRGPEFLGFKMTAGGAFYLVPVNPKGFATGQSQSALLKLFEYTPPPAGATLEFRALHRACSLIPHGRCYRLAQRGAIATAELAAGMPELSQVPLAVGGIFEEDLRPAARVAAADPAQLRVVVREEIRAAVGATLKMLPDLRAALAENQRLLASVDASVRGLRERVPDQGGPPSPGKIVRAKPQTSEREPRPPLPAPAAEPLPPAYIGDFDWIAPVLAVAQREFPPTRMPRDYVLALRELGLLLAHGRPTTPVPARIAFSRVSVDPEKSLVGLNLVELGGHSDGELRFRKDDGSWIFTDSIWQIFVAVTVASEETIASPLALVFPWSRLEKGAPLIARYLVNATRSGPLAEFVRCVEPAILEWEAQQHGYAVVRRMVVAPAEMAPRRA